ncbi:MAG: ATPase, T2SS/T4P/T4SS family [Candidatus Dormibacteria bacterium]
MALNLDQFQAQVAMPVPLNQGRSVAVEAWPRIPEDWRDFIDYVADQLKMWFLDNEHVHDLVEELRLRAPYNKQNPERAGYARQALERVLKNPPDALRLVASDIMSDPAKGREAIHWVAVRASRFWPVSLLVYSSGIEDILYYGGGCWSIQAKGRVVDFAPQTAPEGARLEEEDDLLEVFMSVLSWPQTTGHRALDYTNPVAEANVGSLMRLTVVRDPVLASGYKLLVAMRLQSRDERWDLGDLVKGGMFPEPVAYFLQACVENRVSMLISGPMGSGKTSLLRILSSYIPAWEVVTVIEDGAELHLQELRPNGEPWVKHLQTLTSVPPSVRGDDSGIEFRNLVRSALRLGGTRPILGESRGAEMADVCSAMTAGQEGGMVTIHAPRADQAMDRARGYVLKHPDFQGQVDLADELVHEAIEMVVQLGYTADGGRVITGIVAPMETAGHSLIYAWDERARRLSRVSNFHDTPPRLQTKLGRALNNTIPET